MKAAIFDLDGTLVDSAPDIAHAVNRMLADRGAPVQAVAFIETLVGEGARALVAKLHRALGLPEADVDQDTRIYLDYYAARPVADSRLYADAATALPALRAAGIRLGVCTNKPQALAEQVLDQLGLLGDLSAVVGADTTPHVKPDPRPLLHTLGALGVTAGEAVYVGDTGIDLACARAAGVPCRIVGWGTGPAVPVEDSARLGCFADLLPAAAPA
ncbi:HAD-IA family hydrolase [Inquilinus sp. NPDC058860]|uniref:HAD-IA family hydrolase n=1 Tax=Inquilinus sp. NPDC058860 TaxID=3346652 RepID=UPI0036BADF51